MNSLLHICFFVFFFTLGGPAVNGPATGVEQTDGVKPMDRDTTTELHMGDYPLFEGTLPAPVSLRDLDPTWLTNPNTESTLKATKSKARKPMPPLDLNKKASANDDQTESVPLPTPWTYELIDKDAPAKGGYLRTSNLPYAYLFYHEEGGLMLTSSNYIEVKSGGVVGFNPTELVWVMEYEDLGKGQRDGYRIRPVNHPSKSLMLDEGSGVPQVEDTHLEKVNGTSGKESAAGDKKKAANQTVFYPAPNKAQRLWRFSTDGGEKGKE